MMRAEKVYEPDEDLTHYVGPNGLDQVTLCGKTDWIGETPGEPTDNPVDCWGCQQFVKFVKGHRFDKAVTHEAEALGDKGRSEA